MLTLVVILLAVSLASSAACALVSRVVGTLRGGRPDPGELEVVAAAGGGWEMVLLVRVARPQR